MMLRKTVLKKTVQIRDSVSYAGLTPTQKIHVVPRLRHPEAEAPPQHLTVRSRYTERSKLLQIAFREWIAQWM